MKRCVTIDRSPHIPSDLSAVIGALAAVGAELSRTIQRGPLGGSLADEVGTNTDGDGQKALDVLADDAFAAKLGPAGVRFYASEEQEDVVELNPEGAFALANSRHLNALQLINVTANPVGNEGRAALLKRFGKDLLS